MSLIQKLALTTLTLSPLAHALPADVFTPAAPNDAPAGMAYTLPSLPVENPNAFRGLKIGAMVSHGVQGVELTVPYEYLAARGATVEVIAPSWVGNRALLVDFLKPTMWVKVDKSIEQARVADYDLLLVAGGAWASQVLRSDDKAVQFLRDFRATAKPMAVICSGAQVLIDSGLAKGQDLTGSHTVRVDLENAGAHYLDKSVVVSNGLITSRSPEDLKDFALAIGQALQQ